MHRFAARRRGLDIAVTCVLDSLQAAQLKHTFASWGSKQAGPLAHVTHVAILPAVQPAAYMMVVMVVAEDVGPEVEVV